MAPINTKLMKQSNWFERVKMPNIDVSDYPIVRLGGFDLPLPPSRKKVVMAPPTWEGASMT